MKVTVYGHSDDCVEIEGDLRDEFSAYDKWVYLHFSDGTVVKCGFALVKDKGWHVEIVKTGPGLSARGLPSKFDEGQHYTDVMELEGDLKWVECWSSEDGPTDDDMETWFESFETVAYTWGQLYAAYKVLVGRG